MTTKPISISNLKIGATLVPKRGRKTLSPLYVLMIRRPDRALRVCDLDAATSSSAIEGHPSWTGSTIAPIREIARNYKVVA